MLNWCGLFVTYLRNLHSNAHDVGRPCMVRTDAVLQDFSKAEGGTNRETEELQKKLQCISTRFSKRYAALLFGAQQLKKVLYNQRHISRTNISS